MVIQTQVNDECQRLPCVSENWKSKRWIENIFTKLNTTLHNTHVYEIIDQFVSDRWIQSNPIILILSLLLVVLLFLPVILFLIFGIINAIFAVIGFIVVQAAVVSIAIGILVCTFFCLVPIVIVLVPLLLCINYMVHTLKNYAKLK